MITLCVACKLAIRVFEDSPILGAHSEWYPANYPCPSCGKATPSIAEEAIPADILPLLRFETLTPLEAFIAYAGVGLPREKAFTQETLTTLLREVPIRRVVGNDVQGSRGRFVLEYLELWDGTRVHFAASPEGAVVYRVQPRAAL